MLEAKDQGHNPKCSPKKKGLEKSFSGNLKKKKLGLQKFFSGDLQKNSVEKHSSADLQNFNHSKNIVTLEPRTGQFLRT